MKHRAISGTAAQQAVPINSAKVAGDVAGSILLE